MRWVRIATRRWSTFTATETSSSHKLVRIQLRAILVGGFDYCLLFVLNSEPICCQSTSRSMCESACVFHALLILILIVRTKYLTSLFSFPNAQSLHFFRPRDGPGIVDQGRAGRFLPTRHGVRRSEAVHRPQEDHIQRKQHGMRARFAFQTVWLVRSHFGAFELVWCLNSKLPPPTYAQLTVSFSPLPVPINVVDYAE